MEGQTEGKEEVLVYWAKDKAVVVELGYYEAHMVVNTDLRVLV